MDNYTKYGLIAGGVIALYLVAKKQGLADEVRDDSAKELGVNESSSLMGYRKRRRSRKGRKKKV